MPPNPGLVARYPELLERFYFKKRHILEQLSVPAEQYDDLSPKGSIDDGIRDLITWINEHDGWITTSSCAGRVSVFVEGRKKASGAKSADQSEASLNVKSYERADVDAELRERKKSEGIEHLSLADVEDGEENMDGAQVEEDRSRKSDRKNKGRAKSTEAGIGGKGGGGKWIFISHDPINLESLDMEASSFLGMKQSSTEDAEIWSFTEERLIHFKFEPMILHILTDSHESAQRVLRAALQAGFRESGAINLLSGTMLLATPMVAIRSTGLALDCIVGRYSVEDEEAISFVSKSYLMGLLQVANERFAENSRKIQRFWDLLKAADKEIEGEGEGLENAAIRRQRKRAEEKKRRKETRRSEKAKWEEERRALEEERRARAEIRREL